MGIIGTLGSASGRLHHIEIWVGDYQRAKESLGWMLEQCGYVQASEWECGGSWQGAAEYIVLESGADVVGSHERRRAGLNHLAFSLDSAAAVAALSEAAIGRGWQLMFTDRHPYAGGPEHYAAYLENWDGFEIELVAASGPEISLSE